MAPSNCLSGRTLWELASENPLMMAPQLIDVLSVSNSYPRELCVGMGHHYDNSHSARQVPRA